MLERVPYFGRAGRESATDFTPTFVFQDPSDETQVKIRDDFYGARRKLRLAVQGAGVACLNFLHNLEDTTPEGLDNDSLEIVVYERQTDVGGQWLTSRYPGCRCDQPGVVYQFTWRPNTNWTEFYPPAEETCRYFQDVARENGFYRFMKFRHEVVRASWSDADAQWVLSIKDLTTLEEFEDHVDIWLEFNGPVNKPKISLPGIETFQGQVVHSAAWPQDLELSGKSVAVAGVGASGLQIVPNIVSQVERLYTWFRNKAFILPPGFPYGDEEGRTFTYSKEQRELLSDPDIYLAYRKAVEGPSSDRVKACVNGRPLGAQANARATAFMRRKLASKPEVLEQLLPTDHDASCRRPSISHGYLEALAATKTTVLDAPPLRFTKSGFIDTNGKEHKLDVIIAATGYGDSWRSELPTFVNGENMNEFWKGCTHPPVYMSTCVARMPNYFSVSSAYAPVQGPWTLGTEYTTRYIAKIIEKIQLEHLVSIRPKDRAVDHFVRHANAMNERLGQSGPCSTWYKAPDGHPCIWPGGRSKGATGYLEMTDILTLTLGHFMKMFHRPRFEDFDITYEDENDIFSYFGNGFTLDEDANNDFDKSWYLGRPNRPVDSSVLEKLKGTYKPDDSAGSVVISTL